MYVHMLRQVLAISTFALVSFLLSCNCQKRQSLQIITNQIPNILDYNANPQNPYDRNYLAFSDQGAWFAYGFPQDSHNYGGFAGPFLMTQENGHWCSKVLSQLILFNNNIEKQIDWNEFTITYEGYNSHLKQVFKNDQLRITQTLYFGSAHTAIIITEVVNLSDHTISLSPSWIGGLISKNLNISKQNNLIIIDSDLSKAIGKIQSYGDEIVATETTDSSYVLELMEFTLDSGKTKQLILSHSFVFPEYNIQNEQYAIDSMTINPTKYLQERIWEKEYQLKTLYSKMDTAWDDTAYRNLMAKTTLTLQNNWRIPAGELKHSGLFPSYHYEWFHGMWAWDSWKHAVALVQYDSQLAKDQIRAMYDFVDDDGFIADCIYRDTTIENHNYRNTKPPLSAWAVWKVYEQDDDTMFLKEMYPLLIKQHQLMVALS